MRFKVSDSGQNVLQLSESDLFMTPNSCNSGSKEPCIAEIFINYLNGKLRKVPFMLSYTYVGSAKDGTKPALDSGNRHPNWQFTLVACKKMPFKEDDEETDEHGLYFSPPKRARGGILAYDDPTNVIDWLCLFLATHRCISRLHVASGITDEDIDHRVAHVIAANMPCLEAIHLEDDAWPSAFSSVTSTFAAVGNDLTPNWPILCSLSIGRRARLYPVLLNAMSLPTLAALRVNLDHPEPAHVCGDYISTKAVDLREVTAEMVSVVIGDKSTPPAVYIGDNPNIRRLSVKFTDIPETPITSMEWFTRGNAYAKLQRLNLNFVLDARDYRVATAVMKLVHFIPEVVLDLTEQPGTSVLTYGTLEYERKAAFVKRSMNALSNPTSNLKRLRIITQDMSFAQDAVDHVTDPGADKYTDPPLLCRDHLEMLELDVEGDTLISALGCGDAPKFPPYTVRCRATYSYMSNFKIIFDHPNVTVKTVVFDPKDLNVAIISIKSKMVYCILNNLTGEWKGRPRF